MTTTVLVVLQSLQSRLRLAADTLQNIQGRMSGGDLLRPYEDRDHKALTTLLHELSQEA